MEPQEIADLMALKNWSQTDLAEELGVHRATVCRWLASGIQRRGPNGPACKLMRQWLAEARAETKLKLAAMP